jgi:hypothetical protein
MASEHKFKEYLNLEELDFQPTTLIVGTFNPSIGGNDAAWFYGRFDNNFWDVLPRIYGKDSMRCSSPKQWKLFCKENKIAITDLISSIDDADLDNLIHFNKIKTFSDKTIANDFKQHKQVKIIKILESNPSIKNVYLTRGTGETFWKRLWKPIEIYCKENGLCEKKLITPSGYAFYQQGKYNKQNPLNPLSLEDFILKDWKSKWHELK